MRYNEETRRKAGKEVRDSNKRDDGRKKVGMGLRRRGG
jgi:hypothetical protein